MKLHIESLERKIEQLKEEQAESEKQGKVTKSQNSYYKRKSRREILRL